MSFLREQKKEIMNQQYKNTCCRRALVNGMLFAKGALLSGEKIFCNVQNEEIAQYFATIIKELFGKDVFVKTGEKGGSLRTLLFVSHSCSTYISSLSLEGISLFMEKCNMCKTAFLRGIFLACGRAADPRKQYRIEFAPAYRHEKLRQFLADIDMPFSVSHRRSEYILFSSNSTVAEDLFAAMGLNSTVFVLMNSKIENDFKNSANRIRNCETNNIQKSVVAAARCIDAIVRLEKNNLLTTLPADLEATARLRLEYSDYSLSRLAAEFTPPISKSGLSHRLNKIVELADSLLKEKDRNL